MSQLSKGFRQRVALAGVLVHSPKYIFLDEPTEGLDPNQIRVIRAIIKDLSKDHTVMLSSHILTEVESVCDEVIHIDSGEILKSGQLSDYMSTSTSSSKSYFLKIDENSIKYIPILEKLNGLKLEKVNNGFKIEFDPGVISLNQIILLLVESNITIQEIHLLKDSIENIFLSSLEVQGATNSSDN